MGAGAERGAAAGAPVAALEPAGAAQAAEIEIVRIPLAGADAAARLAAALAAARRAGGYLAAPRCDGVRAFASAAPAEAIVVVRWTSRAAHDAAAAGPAAGAFLAAVGELAAGAPSVGWYDELGERAT